MMNTLRKTAENINTSINFRGTILYDEIMSTHTTFRIGGKAAVFVTPSDIDSLVFLLKELAKEDLPSFIIGGGSNLVISDNGLECCVISTSALNTISAEKCEDLSEHNIFRLSCGSGIPISEVTNFCIKNSYSGFETFSGLPGTIGGAVMMNARCYGKSISDILSSVTYLACDESMTIKKYTFNESDWDYKKSPFQNTKSVILAAEITVTSGNNEKIKAESSKYVEDRISRGHFKYPSAGSVFKNNHVYGRPSGKIIDEAGLRGLSCGGAQIAPWHGNFFINTGNASYEDVKKLVTDVTNKVKKREGITLEPEILFITNGIKRY